MQNINKQNQRKLDSLTKLFIFLIILIILFIAFSAFYKSSKKSKCGDLVCSEREDCCIDCGCAEGLVCKENKCTLFEPPIRSHCGNNICEINEGCFSCSSDCLCSKSEYCDSYADICRPVICGNNICESNESVETCCVDCKCSGGFLCNSITQQCQRKAALSEAEAEQIVADYLKERNLVNCKLTGVIDGIYAGESVVVAVYNCQDEPEWRSHILVINSKKEIVGEIENA